MLSVTAVPLFLGLVFIFELCLIHIKVLHIWWVHVIKRWLLSTLFVSLAFIFRLCLILMDACYQEIIVHSLSATEFALYLLALNEVWVGGGPLTENNSSWSCVSSFSLLKNALSALCIIKELILPLISFLTCVAMLCKCNSDVDVDVSICSLNWRCQLWVQELCFRQGYQVSYHVHQNWTNN